MSGKLPDGWKEVPLWLLTASIQYGYTASAEPGAAGARLLRITDIQDGYVDWKSVPGCSIDPVDLEKYRLQPSDIVFARTGATTGKSFLIRTCPKDAVFASYLIRVRAEPALIEPSYLSFFFQSPRYWEYITDSLAGNAQPNCNGSKLAALSIPVPPIAEQRRIVSKIEALLAEVTAARERLAKVPLILKRFRQAVLTKAYSGDLTEEWREKNNAADWGQKELQSLVVSLEQGWSPKCEIEPSLVGDVWGVIKTTAVQPMEFLQGENKRLPDALAPRAELEVRAGDLLITRAGPRARAGICCLVRITRPKLIVCDKVYRFRVDERVMSARFVELILNAPKMVETIDGLKTGISDSGVNLTQEKFLDLEVPLPSLPEQLEIGRRVEQLFGSAALVEERLVAATHRSDKIQSAILGRAFSGELVPTEADLARAEGRSFESAEQLLARVKGERETGVEAPKRRRQAVNRIDTAETKPKRRSARR